MRAPEKMDSGSQKVEDLRVMETEDSCRDVRKWRKCLLTEDHQLPFLKERFHQTVGETEKEREGCPGKEGTDVPARRGQTA